MPRGGVAAVMDSGGDSIRTHIDDTLRAGAGLSQEKAAKHIVQNGKSAIEWLIKQGVPFTASDERHQHCDYHLTREGGHSSRRVIHAADATGKAISTTLLERVKQQSNIELFDHHIAVELITTGNPGLGEQQCVGAYFFNLNNEQVVTVRSKSTVLASGGASKAYLFTSNIDGATGDGIAMAWRAGCRVGNMEFNQFHPTCLYHPKAKSFLISEAVRGEGGQLLRPDGSRFMPAYDERAELAPRDIVARAIDHEMKRLGTDCMYLDISYKPADFIRSHFPTIHQRCLDFGIDITREPIPVVPAAHYTCGGVVVDTSGRTDVTNLFAIGECAFTGLHGANRLASNSLLECLVAARSCARQLAGLLPDIPQPPEVPDWDETRVTDADEKVVIAHNWEELRRFMWDYVGIVRTNKRLQRAANRIKLLQTEISEFYSHFKICNDLIELRNLTLVSELIVQSALQRKESRGLHYTLDYPELQDKALDTILTPDSYPG